MRNLYILNNAFIESFTHDHFQAYAFLKYAPAFGFYPKIFVAKSAILNADLLSHKSHFHFHFDKILWRINNWTNIEPHAQKYADEFLDAIKDIKSGDVILLPTTSADELFGLHIALTRRNFDAPVNVLIQGLDIDESLFIQILKELSKFRNVKLLCSGVVLEFILNFHKIKFYPINACQDLPYWLVGTIEKKYDFAYLGLPHTSKGFIKVLESVASLKNNFGMQPKFLIQSKGATISDDFKNEFTH